MFEKVNPKHVDKVADRIAGAIVDIAYKIKRDPKIAVEVLIGHGTCHVIIETDTELDEAVIKAAIMRIMEYRDVATDILIVPQDPHLNENQQGKMRCGDNGIFKGVPLTYEQKALSKIARSIYRDFPSDGKYIIETPVQEDYIGEGPSTLIVCQSQCHGTEPVFEELRVFFDRFIINPLGEWYGGIDADTGATNRKLGSDMADSVTGGGLHGKDLSKADVSVNIYAWLKAQETGEEVKLFCAIGDEEIDGKPYKEIVEVARAFINDLGGFEKLAEWGLF